MIEYNKEYTYKQLCDTLNLDVTTGNAKIAQIKKIEAEYNFYHPINNKTKKEKKSYIFTSRREEPFNIYSDSWGGARNGSGRANSLSEEFETVIKYYMLHGYPKEFHFTNGLTEEVYFNNDSISKFFGIYNNIYNIEEKIDAAKYEEVCTMLRSRMKSIIFSKIEKIDGVTLTKGILVSKSVHTKIQRDDYLEVYNSYEELFLKENKYMHSGLVAKDGRWEEMTQFILDKFKLQLGNRMDFINIKKYNKITFNSNDFVSPSEEEYKAAVEKINEYVVSSISKSCEKRADKLLSDYNKFGLQIVQRDSIMEKYNKIIDVCIRRKG